LINIKNEYSNIKSEWNELIKVLRKQPRSIDDYDKWTIEYKKWCKFVAPVISDKDKNDTNLEELKTEYNDYYNYVTTIRKKVDCQLEYMESLTQISKELDGIKY
jgi:hypothetical protein